MKQLEFQKTKSHWQHRFAHGGTLRKKRKGRRQRPLSSREPLHLVFKARKDRVRQGLRTPKRFQLIHELSRKYAKKFFVKVEQMSIQSDHLHLSIRATRRSNFQSFFRVLAGQIAQRFEREGLLSLWVVTGTQKPQKPKPKGLWLYRPFTRVIRGYKAYQTLRNYIQLNEKEARGEIPYRPERLKGLSNSEWETLWS